MSFHRSSSAFEVIGSQLCADCRDRQGNHVSSYLNLDKHLGNRNGRFEWGGISFSKSAKNVHFVNDGDSFVLHASLRTRDGIWRQAKTNLSDWIANHDGKLVYTGRQREASEPENLIDHDPIAATFSSIRDFAEDLTESIFGPSSESPRPPTSSNNHFEDRAHQVNMERSSAESQPRAASEKHSVNDEEEEEELKHEDPMEYSGTRTPVANTSSTEARDGAASAPERSASLTELSAAQQEEFQYELIMRTIKQFLLQGPGATVASNINGEGQRELAFTRGEEKFTLLASSRIRPEILFDRDEYHRRGSWSASDSGTTAARCLTPETVEGEDDEDAVLI